jgi:chromosome segregation protein
MFLKRLELQGFKSFAAKTVIDFPEGITAIVGPNGSGKSNITDAIRWLLGERESKSLRGAKSDDLIFAGTEHRARSGFAQASIYFDNSSGFFPVEYKEVVIARRIDRDGDSRFLLNQSEVRLKDIIDFFARGRMGARGLNIVSQGESDSFLRANPAERRVLIEEMLGLKEYLLKKRSSERELRNTRVNLDKAMAMLEEMKPHIKMLRRQVGRYTERDKLAAELTELENAFYGAKVREILGELARFDPELSLIGGAITEKKEELALMERELKEVESSEPEAKKKIDEIRLKRRELFNERLAANPPTGGPLAATPAAAPKNKKDPMELVREIKNLAASAVEITSMEDLRGALKKILSLIDELEEKAVIIPDVPVPAANPEFEAKMEAFNVMLDELDAMERKFTSEMDGFNQAFRKAIKAVEAKKDELDALEDKSAQVSFEKEKVKYRETELERQLAAMGRSFAEFVGIPETKGFDPSSAERRIYRLRGELASIGEVDESIIKESEEAEERFESVSSQIDELEKASADLKSLIKELDYKIHHEFSGALGKINKELSDFAKLMFGGGKISLRLEEIVPQNAESSGSGEDGAMSTALEEDEPKQGIEIEVSLPKKRVKGLEVLSGGERSLLSTAILFGLISISPPPFIVLDEVDAALDERNARRFGEMLDRFEGRTQFIVVTHNRATMESADALYGVTMGEDGSSKLVSLKLS